MAHEAGLSPVVVVLGHQAELVRAAVAHLTVLTVENPSPERGMTSLGPRGHRRPGGACACRPGRGRHSQRYAPRDGSHGAGAG
jgi:hypothetical protein